MFENNDTQAQYEADFALGGEVEFEELDDEQGESFEALVAGVRAARLAGA